MGVVAVFARALASFIQPLDACSKYGGAARTNYRFYSEPHR